MSAKLTKTVSAAVAGLALSLALAGCSALYPNWGATTLPSDSSSPSESQSENPGPSPEPSGSASSVFKEAQIDVLQADADEAAGTLTVIAQMITAAEDGGVCKLYVMTDDGMKDVTVKAEANVNTTQCFPMTLPLSALGKGKVTYTVVYLSSLYQGASTPQAITLP